MDEAKLKLRKAHEGPRPCIFWIEQRCLPAQARNALLSPGRSECAADPLLPSHQVQIISLDVRRSAILDRFLFLGQQLDLERIDDRFGDLVLDRKNVIE